MKKITYKIQVSLVFILIGLAYVLANFLQNEIIINVAWVISGLLFIINPVYPNFNESVSHKDGVMGARIGGILIILFGFIISYRL